MTGLAEVAIRRARPRDVPAISRLVNANAGRGLMLARSHNELYETLRDFLVVEEGGALLGCAAVHLVNGEIAELKSLAVDDAAQGRGLGRRLVAACLAEAGELGLARLFALTYQVDFFQRCGFSRVDRSRLPEKVWGECVRCNRFLDCDEVALWATVPALPGATVLL